MTDRAAEVTNFLRGTPWENWDQSALAGDASSRRYIRLSSADKTVILMDADPTIDQSTVPFARIAHWLLDQGFCAPEILQHDGANGLMVIGDLGTDDMVCWITRHPQDAPRLYDTATDVLIALDELPPPDDLPRMTPKVGGEMLDVTCAWYAHDVDSRPLSQAMRTALQACCSAPNHLALRDYHAENLIWRPDKDGTNKIGLLDFQDAFVAPRGYDLVSLIRDVRRVVAHDIETRMIARFAAGVGVDPNTLQAGLACLGAQRNLRILGVFARLARRDGKHRYIQMIPHLWDMISKDLTHPELRDLKAVVAAILPPPKHSAIKDLL